MLKELYEDSYNNNEFKDRCDRYLCCCCNQNEYPRCKSKYCITWEEFPIKYNSLKLNLSI